MNTRTLLLLLLVFLGFMLYVEWQSDFANPIPPQTEDLPGERQSAVDDPGADADLPDLPDAAPQEQARLQSQSQPGGETDESVPTAAVARSGQRIEVETDLVIAEIDPTGGTLTSLKLKQYPVSIDAPDQPFELISDELNTFHIAQAGLIDPERRAPNHTTTYSFDRQYYELAAGEDRVEVPLTWRDENGLEVVQTWVFRRDDYVIEHRFDIRNQDTTTWQGSRYLRLQRAGGSSSNGMSFTNPERISFNGAAVYSPEEKFQKLKFGDFDEERYRSTITGGWAGMVEHYFLSAWIPPAEQSAQYTTRLIDRQTPNRYAVTVTSTPVPVPAGGSHVFESRFFAGPKNQNRLDQIAPGLGLTVDYGIFTVFSKPLFWLLDHIQNFVKNWGVAIILLTLLIKIAFYKLTQAQFRSMGKLRKLQPRIQQLKERYGDDRQKFGQAMMEIYKKEKVNPLGGCLPILVQIPIFIALYWVLLESVELRQASFLWVPDLSKPDPLFILPVINGAFMIITQRLTPAAGMDPMQRKIMQWLPVAFAVLFAFFPAGLVLYWASNSGISLLQQWYILRQIDAEDARAKS